MLINDIDLSSLGVKLYDRVLTSNKVDTEQEWLDGDIQPTYIRQQDRFKEMTLSFLVLSANEEEAFHRISRLTALLKRATIEFDDLNLTFEVSLSGTNKPNRLKNGNFIVSYDLTCDYAKGSREIHTTNANMTNAFKLTVLYYKNSNTLLANESITIRALDFEGGATLMDIGVNIDKYKPDHYDRGIATNLGNLELTYENLQTLKVLIINYVPTNYNLTVNYYVNDGSGYYNEIISQQITFTHPQLEKAKTIGQIIDAKTFKPDGYKARIAFTNKELTVNNLLLASPISVFYDKINNEASKSVVVNYQRELDDGTYETTNSIIMTFAESQFIDGMTLGDIIPTDTYRPNPTYYNKGYYEGHTAEELITYEVLATTYTIRYSRMVHTLFVEYYAGEYPNWYRLTTSTVATTYKDTYENEFNLIEDLNIDLNKYHTAPYELGRLNNDGVYITYDNVINAGVLQVYYKPIDYTIKVHYYPRGPEAEIVQEDITINDLMFLSNPILNDIIPIGAHRQEGYQFDADLSYNGEISLNALLQASPIEIIYTEIVELKSKNIIIKYKKELSSTYTTINTSLITINEADVIGGIRLKDIINLNMYRPEYYEEGIIDGTSSTALLTYEQLNSSYDILYVASTYMTPIRYYTDDIDPLNWVGSGNISYRIIDFTINTTLFDLGLNLNLYKPAHCDDGVCQYTGPVNFGALLDLPSIDVVYDTIEEPEGDEISYPHRFLFLEHNDLGAYEHLHPEWTMNHAYINTGVSVDDVSRLTVIMECDRADKNQPLSEVNEGYAYLFGSSSGAGAFFMRYNNLSKYIPAHQEAQANQFEAKAGQFASTLIQTEENAIGFSLNSGIYATSTPGYSRVIFTYSNNLPTDGYPMPYPLYLFANNKAGSYADGLGGIGIYGCRIYYDDELIRDFIPVQFYDKIGDQVAPSDCLYDKVSQTFFEDATGLDSFNIRDDDRYEDNDPSHKIGYCFVDYYKGETLFQSNVIFFRGDDFIDDKVYDMYENFLVDKHQPAFYGSGLINVDKDFVPTFEGLNHQTFQVVYPEQDNYIIVKYYQEDDGVKHLLKEEQVSITEKDFYQVPTFGDIVRINKYKPDGYETDFEYQGARVSLSRVLELSPYEIVYKPMAETPTEYRAVVRYMKKVFGLRTYEVVGTETLIFDQSHFRDGEYIDFYIDFNKYKPEYYKDGEPYEWYPMDERLDTPSALRDIYEVYYMPEPYYVDVNYYTDDIDEENLIASTTWMIQVDDWEGKIQLPDTLDNNFVNKYKPVGCSGGQILNPEAWYDFYDLVALDEISIWYETIVEPDDPEKASYEQKVLYWTARGLDIFAPGRTGSIKASEMFHLVEEVAGRIPYIDLGYRPKEIGRLRVELTGTVVGAGYVNGSPIPTDGDAFHDDPLKQFNVARLNHAGGTMGYTSFFGYQTANPYWAGTEDTEEPQHKYNDWLLNGDPVPEGSSLFSHYSKGGFSLFARVPRVNGWAYDSEGPQYYDGLNWYAGDSAPGVMKFDPVSPYTGITAIFRRGLNKYYDDNYEIQDGFKDYGYYAMDHYQNYWHAQPYRTGVMGEKLDPAEYYGFLANPYHIVLDAYNNYGSIATHEWDNSPYTAIWENTDNDFFEGREQPRGTLSLFQSTDPNTGKVNIMAFCPVAYPNVQVKGTFVALQQSALGNPYTGTFSPEIELIQWVIIGYTPSGKPKYQTRVQSYNVNYSDFFMPQCPQTAGCAIWGLKIYDRNRLVRDLIPVAKGDKIFDYVMPANGLFDKITEIFFGNSNMGGTYEDTISFSSEEGLAMTKLTREIPPEEIFPLRVMYDPLIYGKITTNYYDYDNSFIANQFVDIPTWYNSNNSSLENYLHFNDYKPDDFHLDGMIDLDADLSFEFMSLLELYTMGLANVFYKLRSFTKTVVYYQDNVRIASKDLFYSLEDIQKAKTLEDLGIDVDLYYDANFTHGRVVFDESIIADDNIQAFIDAPSPIVVYNKFNADVAPNLLYVEYYRGGAIDDELITVNPDSINYLDCNLDGVVLNPNGAIKYYNHYHSALYEDEKFDYFIPYQVRVINKYAGIHRGPARRYPTLAMIVELDTYTIIEERNGWGRLKEYPTGWIMLSQTEPMTGPGQNPDYDIADSEVATIPFGEHIHITKLTIDRLWCYVPEVESWVKAEDISYDQAGKLYNGLGIKVINLDDIDFSNVHSLEDMGISIDAYALRFHDYSNYVYDGEYTYEAFSNLHNIEIVYPETIYNYTCIYYKDNQADINELGRAGFSCSISDWNPDWDTFIATSWQVDDNGDPINPTIYRDTDLTLTWDYFGFDKNLYRPTGYGDGIYLWNPRSWDSEKVKFTFEEMIRTGSQYVLYPAITPYVYKSYNKSYVAQVPLYDTTTLFLMNRYSNPYDDDYITNNTKWDVYYEGEADGNLLCDTRNFYSTRNMYDTLEMGWTDTKVHKVDITGYHMLSTNLTTGFSAGDDMILPEVEASGTTYIYNISNFRDNLTFVGGVGNRINGVPTTYYVKDYPDKPNEVIEITDATNLKDRYSLSAADDVYEEWKDVLSNRYAKKVNNIGPYIHRAKIKGTTYQFMAYTQFTLTSYWIPVPKGMWYRFNGEEKRIEANGFFNLITGETFYDDNIKIYLLNDTEMVAPFDYFDEWFYNTTDIDYIVQAKADIPTYEQPDIYAINKRTILSGLVFPVSSLTADADNKVVGEWYYSGDQWLSSANTSIYAGSFDKLKLTKLQQSICLLPGGDYTKFYVYLNPAEVAQVGQTSNHLYGTTAKTAVSHYYYIDNNNEKFYFDGAFWIPEKYTSNYTIEQNKNYAITVDTNYYSVPIAKEEYKAGVYLYGERITVPYVAVNNPNWAYTGKGWIELDGYTSEIL